MTLGAGHTQPRTAAVGKAIGDKLASVGIDWFLGPTVEPITDLTEPLDTRKRFSDNPETVSQHAHAFLAGLNTTNVAACAEASLVATLQEIYRSIDEEDVDFTDLAQRAEIQPINRLIQRNSLESFLLSSSITEFDNAHIAGRSFQTVIQQVLQARLGHRGPTTVAGRSLLGADASSCANHAPLRTLLCGSDVVILPSDPEAQRGSIRAIYSASRASAFANLGLSSTPDRLEPVRAEALARRARRAAASDAIALAQSHQTLIQDAYRESTTTLTTGPSPLLNLPATSILLLLTPSVPPLPGPNGTANADPFEPLGHAIAHFHNRTRHVPYTLSAGVTSTHAAFLERATAVVLVLCNASSAFVESQMEFVQAVQNCIRARDARPGEQRMRRVALAAGDPRDLRQPLEGWWEVCCYEYTSGALEAATEVITGQRNATGIMPIRLGRCLNGR